MTTRKAIIRKAKAMGVPQKAPMQIDWKSRIASLISLARDIHLSSIPLAAQDAVEYAAQLRHQSPQAAQQMIVAAQHLRAANQIIQQPNWKDGPGYRQFQLHTGDAIQALRQAQQIVSAG